MNKPWSPQPKQAEFARSGADITVFGGGAGGGKTAGLVAVSARYIANQAYDFMLLRRHKTEIKLPGGLWSETERLFRHPAINARSYNDYRWVFPSGSTGKLEGLEHDSDVNKLYGTQIPFIGFDEVQHFSEYQFWSMYARNRPKAGSPGADKIRCMVRATCNPEPDSWLSRLLQWWWDTETGLAIKERAGRIRWLVRLDEGDIRWADSRLELIDALAPQWLHDPSNPQNPIRPISLSFIPATVFDNQILMRDDPTYIAKLYALPRPERERLLNGNWKVTATVGDYFPRNKIEIVDAAPGDAETTRGWDLAATKPSANNSNPDWTAGVKIKRKNGLYFVEHVERFRDDAGVVNTTLRNIASQDGPRCSIGLFQDPGQAGKAMARFQVAMLHGLHVVLIPATSNKITLAKPFASQWLAGNVKIVAGSWNEAYINEMNNFDGLGKVKDDQVDASSAAFHAFARQISGEIGLSIPR